MSNKSLPYHVCCLRWNDAWQITLEEDLKRNPLSFYVTLNPNVAILEIDNLG